ncbi:MAG: glutaredoxin 3 [Candidatus Binataceae bacterium]
MARIQIYTTQYCPYCAQAKALLERKGAAYEEIDVTGDSELREKMTALSGGRGTVPEIFIDGRIIGGFDELSALDEAGQLDELLARNS